MRLYGVRSSRGRSIFFFLRDSAQVLIVAGYEGAHWLLRRRAAGQTQSTGEVGEFFRMLESRFLVSYLEILKHQPVNHYSAARVVRMIMSIRKSAVIL